MTPELANRIRASLTGGNTPSRGVAERAIQACEVLSHRLSQLVGKQGFSTIFKRCAQEVAVWYPPWLAGPNPWAGEPRDSPWLWLTASMEQQESATATEGFILVLSEVVELLRKLVGEALVDPLLDEAWPIVFPRIRAARGLRS